MRRTVIRYKTKPDMADRNAELVAAVFAELKAARPEGLRYLSLRLEDDTFIHFVETAAEDGASALPKSSGSDRSSVLTLLVGLNLSAVPHTTTCRPMRRSSLGRILYTST